MKEEMGRSSRGIEQYKLLYIKNHGGLQGGDPAGSHNQPGSGCGCAHTAPGELHLPQGWSWDLSQHLALGDVGSTPTFPSSQVFFSFGCFGWFFFSRM